MIRLFRLLVPASVLTLFLSEAALIYGSYLAIAYFARTPEAAAFLSGPEGWERIGTSTGLILVAMYFLQFYGDLRIRSRILLLQQLAMVLGLVFLAEALIAYLNQDWATPRWVLLPGSTLALVALFLWRILFSVAIRNRVGLRTVLFVGFSPAIGQITAYLGQHPELGFAPLGYLDQSDAPAESAAEEPSLKRLGRPEELYALVDELHPDWLVVGKPGELDPREANQFLEMRFGGVQTEDAAGFHEKTLGRICATEVRPRDLLWSEGLQPRALNLTLQQMYSTAAAVVLSVVLFPLAILAALCAVSSGEPPLLRERRAGVNGEVFTMYLFHCPKNAAGRLLRRIGLFRLPQLWNIIRGQMAFVGPEPDHPDFAARLTETIPFYAHRTIVRPGITGWAQVNQRADGSEGDLVRRLEYDLYYVKNISPILDVFIILRAFRELLFLRPELLDGEAR